MNLLIKGRGKRTPIEKRVDWFRRKAQFFVISSVKFASCLNLQNNLKQFREIKYMSNFFSKAKC